MTTIYLVRHARSTANKTGKLAGRTPNVKLDEIGLAQAEALGKHFSQYKIDQIISSPLERCLQTAQHIQKDQARNISMQKNEIFNECDYGSWSNRKISDLSKLDLWKTIQRNPSQVRFPKGESMLEMSFRVIKGLGEIVKDLKKPKNLVIVSHADPIKALLAHLLGMHLDNFQRIIISPAAINKIKYSQAGFSIEAINDTAHLNGINSESKAPKGAVLGGGA